MHHGKNMRRGKMIAQGAHASMAFLLGAICKDYDGYCRDWKKNIERINKWVIGSGMKKVCLYVKTDEELVAIVEKAMSAGLEVHAITDSGHTEFHGVPTLTCCAIGPDLSSKIDEVTGDLPLL